MMKALKKILLMLCIGLGFLSTEAQPLLTQPGYYKVKFGKFQIVALSDGTVPIDATKLLVPKDSDVLVKQLKQSGLANPVEISINAYLIVGGEKVILVDAGSGELFGSNGGLLQNSLEAAGYRPEDITDILITHIHADHTGGLTLHNKMMFPNAVIHLNKKELDFWNSHEQPQPSDARGITANRPAYLSIKPYLAAGKVKSFDGSVAILPGIRTIEKSGHTAGHTLYCLESGGKKLVFLGDLVHIEQIQLQNASMPDDFDFDRTKGAQQRRDSYSEFAKEGYLLAGDHLSFPGIGRIVSSTDGYKWVPVPYSVLGRTE